MTDLPSEPDHAQPRRILIVGDSNCLPRRDVKYRASWIYLLKQSLPGDDFIVLADGGRTTEFLAQNPKVHPDGGIEYDPSSLEIYEPSIVILNLGIVDCAPRMFRKIESQVIGRLPNSLMKLVIAIARKLRRRRLDRTYVSTTAFEANAHQYLDRCVAAGVEHMIIIGIPTADLRGMRKNPLLRQADATSNSIWARLASEIKGAIFLDPLHPAQDISILYEADGYHLSLHGHLVLFRTIAAALHPGPGSQ